MSKKAQVILLKNTGKNFIEKTNEIIRNKARIEDITQRIFKIRLFKMKKDAFSIMKTKISPNNWKFSTIELVTDRISKSVTLKNFNSFRESIELIKSKSRLVSTVREHSLLSTNQSVLKECFRRLKMNFKDLNLHNNNNKDIARKYLRFWVEKLRSKQI